MHGGGVFDGRKVTSVAQLDQGRIPGKLLLQLERLTDRQPGVLLTPADTNWTSNF
jgi:hypothetical protein